MEPADGLILIYARIRRRDTRAEFWSHFENIPGERVTPTVYELKIADWGDGLWQEVIAWVQDVFEGSTESAIIWQFSAGEYTRYTVNGDA